MMSLLVRNLPSALGDGDLKRLFGRFGRVVRVMFVFDHLKDNTRYAFVDMARSEDAARASERLNGRRVGNRHLIIEFYAPF